MVVWRKRGPAVSIGIFVAGLLFYAGAIAVTLPAAERAATLATIATGIGLICLAALAYRLEERSFRAGHEPSLGISWQDRSTPLVREGHGNAETHLLHEEFLMWNAGDVPILIEKPSQVHPPELGAKRWGGRRTEVWKLEPGGSIARTEFPVVLGKGETCTWREVTEYNCGGVTESSAFTIVARSRREAVEFLGQEPDTIRHLYRVVYFSKPPADISSSDEVHEQYVGIAYRLRSSGR